MNEELRLKITKYACISAAVIIAVSAVIVGYPTYLRGRNLSREEQRILQEIEEKKAEIARYKEYQYRFRTDAEFVESIARQNRRVYPGELVFIFEE